jgi:EF hand
MKRPGLDTGLLVTAEHRRPPLGRQALGQFWHAPTPRPEDQYRSFGVEWDGGVRLRRFKMQKHVLMLATSAFILACGGIAASAQQTPGGPMQPHHPQTQQQPTDHEGRGMMGQGGMMGRGMMGQGGMMGRSMMGPMGPVMMMRIIFSLMDSDGDGTISLSEFQAAHERIFKAMDANKDGRLTLEEMQAFMQGTTRSVPRQ